MITIRVLTGLLILCLTAPFAPGKVGTAARDDRIPIIPVEDFFRYPVFESAFVSLAGRTTHPFKISPDGKALAVICPWEGAFNLFVVDLETFEHRRLTGYKNNTVFNLHWASDDRIIYYILRDGENWGGIYAIDKDGGRPRILVQPYDVPGVLSQTVSMTWLLHTLPDDPQHILVASNDRDLHHPDVYLLDVYQERQEFLARKQDNRKRVLTNPGNVSSWMADIHGQVRFGETYDPQRVESGYIYRRDAASEWETLLTYSFDESPWEPLGFDPTRNWLYVGSTNDQDVHGLYVYDLDQRRLRGPLFSNDRVEIDDAVISRHAGSLVGLYYEPGKTAVKWYSEEMQIIQEMLDRTYPETFNRIISRNRDDSRMIVASYTARRPSFFTLVKLEDGQLKLLPLGESMPWLNSKHLSPVEPITFTARDGMVLHGYLTMPASRRQDERVPLLVHPHGGPQSRDTWRFNPEVQYFANRGFAVLQINFRGSTGYGLKYTRAGYRTWHTDMQNDLIDGVRWAIDQGYADPDRIGIYGASYGGYATMMQLVQHPDVYKFGINFVGVVDIPALYRQTRLDGPARSMRPGRDMFFSRTIGDVETEQALLSEASPITYVAKLQAPVFIIHGGRDYTVPVQQANSLRREMDRLNKPYRWLSKSDEGHGFAREENRIEMFKAIDEFIRPWARKE
jgi:dipeptidyl aminopeptidase/acylaminoacyl peptidase